MDPRLVALSGPLSGTSIVLTGPRLTVGREEGNDLVLSDPFVAPRHCTFERRGGVITVRDADEANPSFINGLPALDRELAEDDRVQIGSSVFIVTTPAEATPEGLQIADVEDGARRVSIRMRREDALLDGPEADIAEPRARAQLSALVRINMALSAVRGLAALERPLLELIADALPAERGALLLATSLDDPAILPARWNRSGSDLPLDRRLVETVLTEGVGIVQDTERDDDGAARSTIAAPLISFDRVNGALVFDAAGAGRFDRQDVRLLMAIAGMAATAFDHARQREWLEGENRRLQAELDADHNMVGRSAAMRRIYAQIARVGPTSSTVLITGESGTGKELVARALHRASSRAAGPFVAINCAALTETLLESELFGHEKGAFTGAFAQKKGLLELGDGGTVFLDEIGELPAALQAKLLRVLQDREFERVGGTRRVRVDFRLITATNRDLEAASSGGAFRRDLFYRLNVIAIRLPPLRDRPDDVPLLASYFVRRHSERAPRRLEGFSPEALRCLTSYSWPGNVRELDNAVERAVVLGSTPLILPEDLPETIVESAPARVRTGASGGPTDFHEALKLAKKDLIVRAVEEAGGNYTAAARLLGLHPNYLHRLVRMLDLKAVLKDQA